MNILHKTLPLGLMALAALGLSVAAFAPSLAQAHNGGSHDGGGSTSGAPEPGWIVMLASGGLVPVTTYLKARRGSRSA